MSIDQSALSLHDTIIEDSDPLKLELDDQDFVAVINDSITASISYYKKKQLPERQKKMMDYYMGSQIQTTGPRALQDFQPRFVENVVYEGVRRIKPIATQDPLI